MNRKKRNFKAKALEKVRKFYEKYIRDLIFEKIYVKGGEEPVKSYAFDKKFAGFYVIFGFISFIILLALNISNGDNGNFLHTFEFFAFMNAIIAFFLTMSILISFDKIKLFIFKKNTILKQVLISGGLIFVFYFLFLTVLSELNFVSYLLALSMIWLFLLSSRFYVYSRKFSTKIESKIASHYSPLRYFIVLITPFFLLGFLVVTAWTYRFVLVFMALNIFASNNPTQGVEVYDLAMGLIMPVIYFSLVLTLLFIVFEYVFTKRRGETKRAGTFDNFTFSLIVFFIFFFQLFQMGIFLLLQDPTVKAIEATFGTGGTLAYIFIFEFVISMLFLYRLITKLGGSLGWRVLFFKKDGLILLFLGCVLAQSLSRYALIEQVENQALTTIGKVLLADKVIISVLMIAFIGITLLIYYLKPHETSMFLRLQKETVSEEEKSMDIVYKLLRNEYVRRGEKYPVEILERELIKSTHLSKSILYSLIHRLAKKDINIELIEKKDEFGRKILWINFISVVGRKFDSKKVSDKKAREFLSKKFLESISVDKKERSQLIKNLQSGKTKNPFIESLTNNYQEKEKAEKATQKVKPIQFKQDHLTRNLKEILIEIIKEEYNYRIETPDRYESFYIPISEISTEIEKRTKITPGELYPIIDNLDDLELKLIKNPEEKEDKLIKFIPISDDNMNYSLANFRPEEYKKVKEVSTKNFVEAIKNKKTKRSITKLKEPIPGRTQYQKDWTDVLTRLHKHHDLYQKYAVKPPSNVSKILKIIDSFINVYENKQKLKKQGL